MKAIAVSVVATILSVSTGHAANAGQTYPYATKPCIWQPYAVTGTTTNWCADYDFGDAPDDNTAGNVISPLGYYYRNCTDYIAWRLSAAGVPTAQYTNLGNAKDWPAAATLKGLVVDETPTASAVAVRTAGPYGHAAFVEAVNADGTITVSQYNYAGQGEYSLQTGLPGSFGFTVYIHFQMQPPAMVVAPPVISAAAPESTSGIPAVDSGAASLAAPDDPTEPQDVQAPDTADVDQGGAPTDTEEDMQTTDDALPNAAPQTTSEKDDAPVVVSAADDLPVVHWRTAPDSPPTQPVKSALVRSTDSTTQSVATYAAPRALLWGVLGFVALGLAVEAWGSWHLRSR